LVYFDLNIENYKQKKEIFNCCSFGCYHRLYYKYYWGLILIYFSFMSCKCRKSSAKWGFISLDLLRSPTSKRQKFFHSFPQKMLFTKILVASIIYSFIYVLLIFLPFSLSLSLSLSLSFIYLGSPINTIQGASNLGFFFFFFYFLFLYV
jgi:hypothetical protein